ncbi:uncharacterized protein LOC114243921 [Bombyx mandarina]|uniref:Uncharacterized protein LOC114243921 n=1 Tax=Bombyx mandarina TaxID=7092 RepID=A0A6J2JQT8_BOMMA|nr:uncharacterized protein LOC114243921 [Bombyx mandarina]
MDLSIADHSDSDSGESWTLLENSSACGEDAPVILKNFNSERQAVDSNTDKDEDTDGISIISDCEQDTAFEPNNDQQQFLSESELKDFTNQYISITPISTNSSDHDEAKHEYDFLGDNNKHKTYVHRRNKRLSTVLNIIMLGSVITAAGVAIGHMWGAKNECSTNTIPVSVNKILSNLYKLQEENAYLRNKLKELTGTLNLQKKPLSSKSAIHHERCQKVYEESLNNRHVEKITKCVDEYFNTGLDTPNKPSLPEYERDFLNDINKLKNVYMQNKSWLDDEIAKRLKNEAQMHQKFRKEIKVAVLNTVREESEPKYEKNEKIENRITEKKIKNYKGKESQLENKLSNRQEISTPLLTEPTLDRISYADSLKQLKNIQGAIKKSEETISSISKSDVKNVKKKVQEIDEGLNRITSDYEILKDDRHVFLKAKKERNKYDRHKSHKKQKRQNKYEQWEMKGGYLKDYDEISLSSQENENLNLKLDQSTDIDKKYLQPTSSTDKGHDLNAFGELSDTKVVINEPKSCKYKDKNRTLKELKWYEKRAAFRTEARKKLEHELFGENNANKASWYFRRMNKREQCRAKDTNNTNRKLYKRQMNYKNKK